MELCNNKTIQKEKVTLSTSERVGPLKRNLERLVRSVIFDSLVVQSGDVDEKVDNSPLEVFPRSGK